MKNSYKRVVFKLLHEQVYQLMNEIYEYINKEKTVKKNNVSVA